MRLAIAAVLVAAMPSAARADCAPTCDSICYAGPSAMFLGEVTEVAAGGYPRRVRIVERLGGSEAVLADVGDDREDIYSESIVAAGDQLVFAITEDDIVFNTAWRVEADVVQCTTQDRTVALDAYVAMGTSSNCEALADQLELRSRCDDTVGCNAGAGGSAAMLGVIALVLRRRRRAA